jgi:hypothetical protein
MLVRLELSSLVNIVVMFGVLERRLSG